MTYAMYYIVYNIKYTVHNTPHMVERILYVVYNLYGIVRIIRDVGLAYSV